MKQICFVRHAKSSWSDISLKDIDRPLNERGKRDAPYMSEHLKDTGLVPDAIISSPAKRAYTTAKKFAETFGISKEKIIKEKRIYEAYQSDLLEVVQSIDDQYSNVLFFGHNPGFTVFVNYLNAPRISNLPTCGIVSFSSKAQKWKDFDKDNCQFNFFKYPKMFFS